MTSKRAEIRLSVLSVADVPSATDDAVVIRQGTLTSIDILVNDLDGDGDAFWLNDYTQPMYGSAHWSDSDRMIWYQPDEGFAGIDQFTYTLADQDGIGSGTVMITVNGAPVAIEDQATVGHGESVTIDVLANDTDAELDVLTVSAVSKPAHGSAIVNLDNTVTYSANTASVVGDSFTYSVTDSSGNTSTASVDIQRGNGATSPPSAGDDEFLVLEDSVGNTLDLLTNDQDPAGGALMVTIVSSPSHGDLVVDAMQSVTYVPDADYSGSDSFTYSVSSANGEARADVEITVQSQNDLPVAVADAAETTEDVPVTIDVLANDSDIDGDVLFVESVADASLGTVILTDDGHVLYTPNPDASGADQLSYVLSDGFGGRAMTTIDVLIAPVNDAPNAVDVLISTDKDQAVPIPVLGSDVDPDGDPLVVVISMDPAQGTALVDGAGIITYSPSSGFEGFDTFIYQVTDPWGLSAEASVIVTVGDPNLQPAAVNDDVTAGMGTAIRIDVLANDSDPDGDELSIYRVGKPRHGTAEIHKGKIVYHPDDGFTGTDQFTYRISDGTSTDTGRITIVVAETGATRESEPNNGQ